jgi:dihydroorotase
MSVHDAPVRSLSLTQPDDWHLHLRDGAAMASVLPASAAQFARAIVMPNLKPPVTTAAQARDYYARIKAALPRHGPAAAFEPLMTLYLTDSMSGEEIRRAQGEGLVKAVKLYPAGATTHSDAGVTDVRKTYKTLEVMQQIGMPLLIHGEVVDSDVDTFDREAVFIERVLIPLRAALPGLKVVFEHITTREAVQYVLSVHDKQPGGAPLLGATVTAHHLLYNRNALFTGGMRPHFYCLPVLKREVHRQALLKAATSGDARFFLGTDSAPHASRYKEQTAACAAGCYTAPAALELYAEAFDAMHALDRLEAFASFHGADFYGLPRNTQRVTLRREAWSLPASYAFGDATVVPLRAGETLQWKLHR